MTSSAQEARPAEGLEYHQIYRAGRQPVLGWSLGGVLTAAALFFLVNALVVAVAFQLWWAVTGVPADDWPDRLASITDTDHVTPSVLLFVNLVLVLGIPTAWLCVRLFQGLRPRWLASVRPRIRWGWLAASFGIAIVVFVLTLFLGALVPTSADGEQISGQLNEFTPVVRDFLLVIVLLTPLQAIAEEYLFRGYLTQAMGAIFEGLWTSRIVAVLVPATLFALAHGAQDFAVFADRFAFGISAGIVVIATGGLEAGIAYHVLNNLLAFGVALAFGDMTTVLTPEGGRWWGVLITVIKSVVFVGLSILVARKLGVATRTSGQALGSH